MGKAGAQHLSRSDWKKLKSIGLGIIIIIKDNNDIGEEGSSFLSKADWPNL